MMRAFNGPNARRRSGRSTSTIQQVTATTPPPAVAQHGQLDTRTMRGADHGDGRNLSTVLDCKQPPPLCDDPAGSLSLRRRPNDPATLDGPLPATERSNAPFVAHALQQIGRASC